MWNTSTANPCKCKRNIKMTRVCWWKFLLLVIIVNRVSDQTISTSNYKNQKMLLYEAQHFFVCLLVPRLSKSRLNQILIPNFHLSAITALSTKRLSLDRILFKSWSQNSPKRCHILVRETIVAGSHPLQILIPNIPLSAVTSLALSTNQLLLDRIHFKS